MLGIAGYWIVAIAALLSTAGAANATLYPAQGLLGYLARERIFPPFFGATRRSFQTGLLLTSIATLAFIWFFDLTAIASLGSAVALLIFLSISVGHLRVRKETGASTVLLTLAILTVVVTLIGFLATTLASNPTSLAAFIGIFVLAVIFDAWWRAVRDRRGTASYPTHRGSPA